MPATTVTYTGVDGGSFINVLIGPANGVLVDAASVGLGLQGAANNLKWGVNHWVNGVDDGSTWAGSITFSNLKRVVVVATAANATGTTSTGLGSGTGVQGIGGATGVGVQGTGGGTSGIGVSGQGGPNSAGGVFTGGANGTGVQCDGAGTGYALLCGTGNARFTGAQPAKTADPGANGVLTPTNIVKAWGSFTISSGVVTFDDGYNVASISVGAVSMTVTLARAMANTTFAPTVNGRFASAAMATPEVETTSTTTFTVIFRVSSSGALIVPNDASTNINGTFIVCGRQ